MRSRLLPLVLLTALAVPVTAFADPGPLATRASAGRLAPPPTASPAAPLPGELVTLRGDLGRRGRQPVQVQRRNAAGDWVTVGRTTATRSGRYTFTTRTRLPRIVVRVLAPSVGDSTAITSRARVIRTASSSASVALSGDRTHVVATGTVTPVRPGRPLRLQADRQGWRTIAVKPQTGAQVSFGVPDPGGLPTSYRVVAAPWRGADLFRGTTTSFTPAAVATGLPRITLATTGGAPVVDRESYLPGTLQVDGGALLPMQVRGRGNGTWKWPKKPYRIKLDSKSPLLGMPTEKDWVLLANYSDRSLLRTWTAFGIARQTSMGWTPQAQFVDVTLNGVDLGSYQLVEAVEESSQKVVLKNDGLLLEVDSYYTENGDPGFTTAHGTPVAYKDPDDPTPEQQAAVQADVAAFEDALYGDDFTDATLGYAPFVDLTSFADWYLVNEAMKNIDGDFFSSVFVSWDPLARRFTMGPVWDFDLSSGYVSPAATGCCAATSGWWLRGDDPTGRPPLHATHWLARMVQDPAFLALVEQRWHDVVGPAVRAQIAAVPAQSDLLTASATLDWVTWRDGFAPAPGTVHADDQTGEEALLLAWLEARADWMDGELG